jgi:hypothetical protein
MQRDPLRKQDIFSVKAQEFTTAVFLPPLMNSSYSETLVSDVKPLPRCRWIFSSTFLGSLS